MPPEAKSDGKVQQRPHLYCGPLTGYHLGAARGETGTMVKTLLKAKQQAEPQSKTTTIRHYAPEEFEADTTEERPVAMLAERRRQFLAGLKAR